jgi:hypothetical protein
MFVLACSVLAMMAVPPSATFHIAQSPLLEKSGWYAVRCVSYGGGMMYSCRISGKDQVFYWENRADWSICSDPPPK